MEIRLTPDQQRGVTVVQDVARAAGMNIYLTGGAIRDIISGFTIRDLDFTVQGNALKLQKELERTGATISATDDDTKTLHLVLPGNVRAEISMARIERYEKTGKPPVVTPATIIEDLRRRDFTVNAMALSLNPGSRGLLMDPFNGAADIEAKLIRILHNYAFVEDPSRLIRASRFAARFHWPLEERTQARFDAAKENKYIEYITDKAIGQEIEQLAYEDDPLHIVRVLEKEDWLKVLNAHWSSAKIDTAGLAQLMKTRQQMNELGYSPDPAPAVLYFLTSRLADKDISDIRKLIPRKDLVEAWRDLEDNAKSLAKRLSSKEAATPSRAWKLLSETRPEMTLFLAVTARQQAVEQKIKNFFTKWRQVQQKVPLPEMTELHITPQMPEYPKIAHDVFMLLLDGKLRSRTEIQKFLKPLAPPPPPPPPLPKRGRAAKAAAAAAAQPIAAQAAASAPTAGNVGKKKGKTAAPLAQTMHKPEAAAHKHKPEKPAPAKKSAKPAKKPDKGKKSK
jgi:tRNA nucleotidyltransferase/poly(A) polymerase